MAVTAEVKDRVAAAGVVVGVVRSASEKFFSAGADVKGFLARSAGENLAMVRRAHQVFDRFAAGGGYRIGLPEVTLGLLPGTGGTQRLPRLIGRGRALELLTSGRTVAPAEAERLGMVDRLVPASEFDTVVADLAAGLAAGAPLAVAAITRVVNDGLERSLADGLDRELEELASLFPTEDAREGMMAFTEKRPPKYAGR